MNALVLLRTISLFLLTLTGTIMAQPVADDSAFTVAEGGTYAGQVTASGDDGATLNFALVSGPAFAALTFNGDGSFSYQSVRQPTVGFVGTDSFTFVANDGLVDSNVATVTVNIGPVNDAPVAQDSTFSVDEGATHVGVVSATDADGDALSFSLVSGPSSGNLVFDANGSFNYQSFAGSPDTDSFTFRANDGLATSNTATVSIAIRVDCKRLRTDTLLNGSEITMLTSSISTMEQASEQTLPQGRTVAGTDRTAGRRHGVSG